MLYVLGGGQGKEKKAEETRRKEQTAFEPSRFYVTDQFFKSERCNSN